MFVMSPVAAIIFGAVIVGLLLWRAKALGSFAGIVALGFVWMAINSFSPLMGAIVLLIASAATLVAIFRYVVLYEEPTRK